jgi:2'-5' RNA ligase
MPRLFVAIDLPDDIKVQIEELCAFGMPGVKWVDSKQYHLSLGFIGEVDFDQQDSISTALAKIKNKAFDLSLGGMGLFPNTKSPRVIWVGVKKSEELLKLQKKVEFQLSQIGISKEHKKFRPHITIGRVKSNKIKRIGDYIAHYDMFRTGSFDIQGFSLFQSKLTPSGAIYSKVSTYQLD